MAPQRQKVEQHRILVALVVERQTFQWQAVGVDRMRIAGAGRTQLRGVLIMDGAYRLAVVDRNQFGQVDQRQRVELVAAVRMPDVVAADRIQTFNRG